MSEPILKLTEIDLLDCSGVEAEAFLQSLLCNDVRELERRNAQWTALLMPQGRVIAVMALIRLDPEHYLLAVPQRRGAAVLEQLKRFVLRRKLQLQLTQKYAVLGTDADSKSTPGTALTLAMNSGRRWFLCSANEASRFDKSGVAWHLEDLRDGLPFLSETASAKYLAHSLRLDSLPAINFKKGCYPGQEIVARTHFLGRNKRGLCLLSVGTEASDLAIGHQIRTQDAALAGEIVDIEYDNHCPLLLVVISLELLSAPLFVRSQGSESVTLQVLKKF